MSDDKPVTVPFNISPHGSGLATRAPADLTEENLEQVALQIRARAEAEGIRITAKPTHIRWDFDWDTASAFERWHLAHEVSMLMNNQGHKPPFTVSLSSLEWADRPCDLRALWESEEPLAVDGEMVDLGIWPPPDSVVQRRLLISRRLMDAVSAFIADTANPAL